MPTSRWLRRCGGSTAPEVRLICLPNAGAGASMFNRWELRRELATEVWGVQPPGRENRQKEPPLRRLDAVVRALAEELQPLLDLPYVLFGHSMGALTAFELCRALRRAGAPLPLRLMVSAHRAPDLPAWRPRASTLPRPEFLARLAEMAGPSTAQQVDTDLLDFLSPMMRADFELCETYRYVPEDPMPMPFTCFAAVDDPEVRVNEMLAWRRHTTQACQVYPFAGGHLFVRDRADEVLGCIATDVAASVEGASA